VVRRAKWSFNAFPRRSMNKALGSCADGGKKESPFKQGSVLFGCPSRPSKWRNKLRKGVTDSYILRNNSSFVVFLMRYSPVPQLLKKEQRGHSTKRTARQTIGGGKRGRTPDSGQKGNVQGGESGFGGGRWQSSFSGFRVPPVRRCEGKKNRPPHGKKFPA